MADNSSTQAAPAPRQQQPRRWLRNCVAPTAAVAALGGAAVGLYLFLGGDSFTYSVGPSNPRVGGLPGGNRLQCGLYEDPTDPTSTLNMPDKAVWYVVD